MTTQLQSPADGSAGETSGEMTTVVQEAVAPEEVIAAVSEPRTAGTTHHLAVWGVGSVALGEASGAVMRRRRGSEEGLEAQVMKSWKTTRMEREVSPGGMGICTDIRKPVTCDDLRCHAAPFHLVSHDWLGGGREEGRGLRRMGELCT